MPPNDRRKHRVIIISTSVDILKDSHDYKAEIYAFFQLLLQHAESAMKYAATISLPPLAATLPVFFLMVSLMSSLRRYLRTAPRHGARSA